MSWTDRCKRRLGYATAANGVAPVLGHRSLPGRHADRLKIAPRSARTGGPPYARTHADQGDDYMTDTAIHKDNDTPTASDDDVKRMDADTPHAPAGAAVADQGVGVNPIESSDPDNNDDPKAAGTPVHPRPTQDRPQS